ncbi:MAG TPA: efflux transporter outer membrane subunit [Anaeromyxobacter sp.]|nr:efflux transporter outer membrane subunit [Anaeromyxobacter sp.]
MRERVLAGALSLLVASCSLAPRYQRPEPPVAAEWPGGAPRPSAEETAAADLGWRDVIGDARLQAVVELALLNNRDLRVASLNVELARARYGIQRSALLPEVDGTASYVRNRTPLDQSVTGRPFTSAQWSVGAGIPAWELDLFGRVRSLKDAALESWLATQEAQRGARLSLVAETADLYLTTRALDEELDLAGRTLELVRASHDLTRRRYEAGLASELDLRTAEVQVQTARVNLAAITQQRAQAEDALVLLVGQPLPASLPPPAPLDDSGIVMDLPVGLPSQVLLRRPDVLAAEHALKSANASIGAARAAFFPTISLTAFGGYSSSEVNDLFDRASGLWSFMPRISVPIFTAGRNVAGLEASQAQRDIAVARYEQAIQAAFRDVADALASRDQIETQVQAGKLRVEAGERRYRLAELRFNKGVDSSLSVIIAQQDLYASQHLLVLSRLARLENLVNLYRALGGGWLERTGQRENGAGPAAGS